MSKSEKRYFKIYSARHSGSEKNNYLRLFEYIDKLDCYDESKIKKEFKEEKFTENFFAIKKYLFDVILNSLVEYNKERLITYKLYEDILKIDILFSKGLNKTALKISEKALELAKANSKYFIIEELLQIQSDKILSSESIFLEKKFDAIGNEKFKVLEELSSMVKYSVLSDKVQAFILKTQVAGSKDEIKKLDWLKKDSLFFDESNAKGFHAREDLFKIKGFYYWFNGNLEKSLEYRKKRFLLMDEYPVIKENEPGKYFINIHSYLMYAWFELQDSECEEYYEKFKLTAEKIFQTIKDEAKIKNTFMISFIMEIMWYERKNEAEKIFSMLENLEDQLKQFTNKLEPQKFLDIYSAAGASLFRMGYYERSLALTNTVLNHENVKLLETIHHVNLVRAIVTHYELGNYDIIESLTKSLARINRKNKRGLDSEKKLIMAINQLIKTTSKKVSEDILDELKHSLEELFNSSMMDKIFIIRMGLLNWVNMQLEKIN